jgi:hypothetical protein
MICPTCGRPQLSEHPHVHVSPKVHRDPPRRPQPPLIDDGYLIEPEPLDPRVPRHERRERRRAGCSIFVLAVVVLWRLRL